MRRLFSLCSFLLAVLWLPATQHCALEAAGWVGQTCSDNCEQDAATKDGCDLIESGAYKASVVSLKVPAPALFASLLYFSFYQATIDAALVSAIAPRNSFDRPLDWVSTWHFVRRAAPSPRAPSLLLA